MLGYVTAHRFDILIPYSFDTIDTMKLAFIQGLFEILEASDPVFSTLGPDGLSDLRVGK